MTSEDSTTPELVDLVRRSFTPVASRDVAGIMSFYVPDAVWDLTAIGLGVFRGREAIAEFMEDWFRSYDRIEQRLENVTDVGGGVRLP